MTTATIPNHSHCIVCTRAVKYGERICSPECQKKAEAETKQRRKMLYIMYGLLGLGLLMLFVGPLFGGR